MIELFTIGFTKKNAQTFFSLLKSSGIKTVIDTRLNNTGQLAGFTKRDDLAFFLNRLVDAQYVHWKESAPTEELLSAYKKKKLTWNQYEIEYRSLISHRRLHESDVVSRLPNSCLLCSEAKPHKCHRRILAEYLQETLSDRISVTHLT